MPDRGEDTNKTEQSTSIPPEGSRRPAFLKTGGRAALVPSLCLALLFGVGGYLFGKSTGPDLEQARQLGVEVGSARGAERGASKGYSASFPKTRKRYFDKAYTNSYRKNYARAYGDAGLTEPEVKSIEVSR